jgi:hypothetical protein
LAGTSLIELIKFEMDFVGQKKAQTVYQLALSVGFVAYFLMQGTGIHSGIPN